MKKNIIIVSHAMYIGGGERSLLGLLSSFNYDEYNVDLFLMRQEGEFLKDIPHKVNVLQENDSRFLAIPIKEVLKNKKVRIFVGRCLGKLLAKIKTKLINASSSAEIELLYSHKYTYRCFKDINPKKNYDLAISFLTPHYICLEKVKAKKKIAWIHTDYSTIEIDRKNEIKMWNKFDNIVSISDAVTDTFVKVFPSLKDKIIRVDNIMSSDFIYAQLGEKISDMDKESSEINFLSVGRYCYPKNFDNVPAICRYLLDYGMKIKWYIIGYGEDEDLIRSNIMKFNVQNNVILLGKKENPYPYMHKCDFYIQPSRYEGKAVSVVEALILKKIVIITNYATAKDQLKNGEEGIIVSLDNEACAKEIFEFVKDKELQRNILKNISQKNYSNESEVNKILELID